MGKRIVSSIHSARELLKSGKTLVDRDGDLWRYTERGYELKGYEPTIWFEAAEPQSSCCPFSVASTPASTDQENTAKYSTETHD